MYHFLLLKNDFDLKFTTFLVSELIKKIMLRKAFKKETDEKNSLINISVLKNS